MLRASLSVESPEPLIPRSLLSKRTDGVLLESRRGTSEADLEALLSGRLRLVELTRHGTAIGARLKPSDGARRGLSPKERRVLERLLAGRCQKEIASDVHVAVTTVSAQVRSALDKLGLACWEQAVVIACLLEARRAAEGGESSAPPSDALALHADLRPAALEPLTLAEREVALHIVDGLSNSEIAKLRRTSPRTVANQVASVFHKLGVQRRLELVRLLAGHEERRTGCSSGNSDMMRSPWVKRPKVESAESAISTAGSSS